mgnify:CR=1 FL=1
MRPSTYSDEQIIEAGNALLLRGQQPTPFAIKTRLGGGNVNRIQKVWSKHHGAAESVSEPASALTELLQVELDSTVSVLGDAMRKSLQRLFSIALEQAGIENAGLKETIAALEQRLASSVLEASDAIELLETTISERDGAIEQLHLELQTVQAERNSAQIDSATAKATVALLQQQLDETQLALLDARRHEQAAREREATCQGQLLAMDKQHLESARTVSELRSDLKAALGMAELGKSSQKKKQGDS